MSDAATVARALAGARSVLVSSHRGIDGDSAGAALSIVRALRRRGARAEYVNAEPPPPHLAFLPMIGEVRAPDEVRGPFDLSLVVDTSDRALLGEAVLPLLDGRPVVVVDHHIPKEAWGDIVWTDPVFAAVCEQVYEILRAMGEEIDAETANLLYTGLVTDTGSFHQNNTTPRTHEVAAACLRAGARPYDIARALFESIEPARARLLGRALASFRLVADGRIAVAVLSRADFAAAGAGDDETEGIAHHLRGIKGIEVALLVRETPDGTVRINFRAKGEADVAAAARRLGGGGHRAAAGATITGLPLEKAVEVAIDAAGAALAP